MEKRIQTGLRIPKGQYEKLLAYSRQVGVSVNSAILLLLDIGYMAATGDGRGLRALPDEKSVVVHVVPLLNEAIRRDQNEGAAESLPGEAGPEPAGIK